MNVFGDYSKYYDLLYCQKPYQQEAEFVSQLLKRYAPSPIQNILELGCGTGRHATHLAKMGYHIHGIDKSALMLEMAGALLAKSQAEIRNSIRLEQGDIRRLALKQQFDAAISLFHVLSYQITNLDLEETFQAVKSHVKPGGIFLFDCWYGPGVLTQKAETRFKNFENDEIQVERIAVPTLFENDNTIEVDYHLFIREKTNEMYHKLREKHLMRYLFYPEIMNLCKNLNMHLVHACEWLTNQELSKSTWGACFVIKV